MTLPGSKAPADAAGPPGTDSLPGSIPQHGARDPGKQHAVWPPRETDGETHSTRWHGKIGAREDGRETKR